MINVSEELKNAVINEVIPKQMHVKITDTSNLKVLNWYREEIVGSWTAELDLAPNNYVTFYTYFKFREDGAINYDYKNQATTMGVGSKIEFSNIDADSSQNFVIRLQIINNDDSPVWITSSAYLLSDSGDRFNIGFDPTDVKRIDYFSIVNTNSTKNIKCTVKLSEPRIYMYIDEDYVGITDYSNIMATDNNVNKYIAIGDFTNANLISESFSYVESICSNNKIKFGLCESASVKFSLFATRAIPNGCDVDITLGYPDIEDKFEWNNFQISEVKKTMSGEIPVREITAYDRMSAMNDNVYAFYTKYMWGMNLNSSAPAVAHKFDYARQIYGTLHSFLYDKKIEKTILYNIEHYQSDKFNPSENQTRDRYFNYKNSGYNRVVFSKKTITRREDCDVCAIRVFYQAFYSEMNLYDYDEFRRGILYNACVYIDFNLDGGEVVRILADEEDIIAIPPNCSTFDVYVPYATANSSWTLYPDGIFATSVNVRQYKNNWYDVSKIVNGYKQLPYYKYSESGKPTVDDIVKVSSELTLRDVVSSICELCGCFFRLDRNGIPCYLYPSEHGLYPSNTLYPSDTLFPKKSSEMTMPTSYYIRATYEDEQIAKFGGVQTVVNSISNTGGVVRWEYWEGEEVDSSYIIDDNIFLCSDEITYIDSVNDIPDILENIYGCLDNAQYTPYEAETIGTPFLESGDRFTLLTKNDGFESFIFERQLKGIQALKDYFCARGIQKTDKLNNYEWES